MLTIPDFSRFSAFVNSYSLAAATAEPVTKPTNYNTALFVADCDCYIRRGGTAIASVSDVTDGTASIYIPAKTQRVLDFGAAPNAALASVSIISTAGGNATFEWFA